MRIVAFSDLHLSQKHAAEVVAASADADLVIGAGDFCNMRNGLPQAMEMLAGIDVPFVTVPGNAESETELREAAPAAVHVLHGHGVEVSGLRIFGLGYGVPPTPFGAWSCDLEEAAAEELLDRCDTADLLICHSPPKGVADVTSHGQSVGSTAIRAAIVRLQPPLMLCGHVHDCWGEEGRIGDTRIVNLGPVPHVFDMEPS